jgi:amidohydrolase
MDQSLLNKVYALRAELHGLAELSGREQKTKKRLADFLRGNTSLFIEDNGQWFCALHKEAGARETIAFRAEMDALPSGGGAAHLCGHDGHGAVLAGLGMLLENRTFHKNILLVFQHAEETGEGGRECSAALSKYNAARAYAFHNVPGYTEGTVLLREGTFACASRGMAVRFTGAPSHAAYPEDGRNPGFAAARFTAFLPELEDKEEYGGLAMVTLAGAKIGQKAFGIAAGEANVWLTLRSWQDADMEKLIASIKKNARMQAAQDGVGVEFAFEEVFPATVNDAGETRRTEQICRKNGLACVKIPEPFRWSEDFAYYGMAAKTVMAGIGAGEAWPRLHTKNYEFNDRIIPAALTFFLALAKEN